MQFDTTVHVRVIEDLSFVMPSLWGENLYLIYTLSVHPRILFISLSLTVYLWGRDKGGKVSASLSYGHIPSF